MLNYVPKKLARVTWLWCRKSLEGLEIAPRFRLSSDDWKTLSVSPAANWYLSSNQGKDKAAKGEGWAPPYISCSHDIAGL